MKEKLPSGHRYGIGTGQRGARTKMVSGLRRSVALFTACTLGVSVLVGLAAGAAADTAPANPADPRTPVTVSSDPLPTAQLDGVAWQQVVVGDIVYVAGKFANARPAGAAAGTSTVPRNNVLAYRLSTGELLTSFAPSLNGQALAIAASPDGSTIYVGGEFSTVDGMARSRVVALNAADGSVLPGFRPRIGGTVRALAVSGDTVYAGGTFTTVGSVQRSRLASFRASDGNLLPWSPATDNRVNALVLSPDTRQVLIGGAFTTLNGSSRPGYGLGRVDAVSGASLSLGVNNTVRNAGKDSAILSLSSDGTNFYGTGYIYGTGGNLEGSFSGTWSDGNLAWVEDCHGDSYGVWASSTAVYLAGHPHYCANIGGFPETKPRTEHRALAFSKAATGVMTRDTQGYPSFPGVPSPSLLNWFPDLDQGTASGQTQGPWAVAGNEQYVVMAGEFRNVNNRPQQGLVRFAVRELAPNTDGPRVSGANANPTLVSNVPGTVELSWRANWDRDNELMTYRVIRDGRTTPVYVTTRQSRFYDRPTLTFTDTGLGAGPHTYRITTSDPWGNTVRSDTVTVTVAAGAVVDPGGETDPDPVPEVPPGGAAGDTFERNASGNWGTADAGGSWSHTGGTARWTVDGTGNMILDRPGLGLTAQLGGLASQDTALRVDASMDKLANGGGSYLSAAVRRTAAGEYRGVIKVSSGGNVTVELISDVAGTSTKLSSASLSGLRYTAGRKLSVRLQAEGTGSTLVRIKVWPTGTAEPTGWTATATDTAAQLQQPGTVALNGYISGSTANVPVTASFDNLSVTAP